MGRKSLSTPVMRKIKVAWNGINVVVELDNQEQIINRSRVKQLIAEQYKNVKGVTDTGETEPESEPEEENDDERRYITLMQFTMNLFDIPNTNLPCPKDDGYSECRYIVPEQSYT